MENYENNGETESFSFHEGCKLEEERKSNNKNIQEEEVILFEDDEDLQSNSDDEDEICFDSYINTFQITVLTLLNTIRFNWFNYLIAFLFVNDQYAVEKGEK